MFPRRFVPLDLVELATQEAELVDSAQKAVPRERLNREADRDPARKRQPLGRKVNVNLHTWMA
jgi:hypothetical protein